LSACRLWSKMFSSTRAGLPNPTLLTQGELPGALPQRSEVFHTMNWPFGHGPPACAADTGRRKRLVQVSRTDRRRLSGYPLTVRVMNDQARGSPGVQDRDNVARGRARQISKFVDNIGLAGGPGFGPATFAPSRNNDFATPAVSSPRNVGQYSGAFKRDIAASRRQGREEGTE
jgi:hypothetical protein